MRTSTFIAGAAMAAGVFASPLKRAVEVVTESDIAYTTVYATVTDGVTSTAVAETTTWVQEKAYAPSVAPSSAPASAPASAPSSAASAAPADTSAPAPANNNWGNYGGGNNYGGGAWTSYWTSTLSVATTSTPPPPPPPPASTPEPTTAVATSAAPSSAAAPANTSPTHNASPPQATTYQERVIVHHNVHRANHSACDLVWDNDLANTAAQIAATCVYAHSMDVNGGGYGQNIAAGVEANNVSAVITELFYNGEVGYYTDLYGQADPDMTEFEKWGHFSQLVWKDTTKVGCATQYCPNGLANVGTNVSPHFTVCNYAGPGNYGGEYAENVGDSLNQATVDWDYCL